MLIDLIESKMPTRMRIWLNRELDIRRKHGILFFTTMLFLIFGFYSQTSAQAFQQCNDRNENRHNLKTALLFMVDLSDVLPENPEAISYTTNRTNYINSIDTLKEIDC